MILWKREASLFFFALILIMMAVTMLSVIYIDSFVKNPNKLEFTESEKNQLR